LSKVRVRCVPRVVCSERKREGGGPDRGNRWRRAGAVQAGPAGHGQQVQRGAGLPVLPHGWRHEPLHHASARAQHLPCGEQSTSALTHVYVERSPLQMKVPIRWEMVGEADQRRIACFLVKARIIN